MTKELKGTTSEQPSKRRVLKRERKAAEVKKSTKVERHNDPSEMPEEQIPTSGRVRIRLIPIWLRILIVLVLLVAAVAFGAMFGYSVIGEGEASDIFKKATWQHIFDIMNGVQ